MSLTLARDNKNKPNEWNTLGSGTKESIENRYEGSHSLQMVRDWHRMKE